MSFLFSSLNTQILIYLNLEYYFLFTTDARVIVVGVVLSQGPVGQDLHIGYTFKTLCIAETKYSTIEREPLAIVCAFQHFPPYLSGRQFILIIIDLSQGCSLQNTVGTKL